MWYLLFVAFLLAAARGVPYQTNTGATAMDDGVLECVAPNFSALHDFLVAGLSNGVFDRAALGSFLLGELATLRTGRALVNDPVDFCALLARRLTTTGTTMVGRAVDFVWQKKRVAAVDGSRDHVERECNAALAGEPNDTSSAMSRQQTMRTCLLSYGKAALLTRLAAYQKPHE